MMSFCRPSYSGIIEREMFKKSLGIYPPGGSPSEMEKRRETKQRHVMELYKKKGNLVPNKGGKGGHSLISGPGMPMIRYTYTNLDVHTYFHNNMHFSVTF